MKDTIQISAAMARFNRALELADELSGFRFDRCPAEALVNWLAASGRNGLAIELQSSARAAKCWTEHEETISRQ